DYEEHSIQHKEYLKNSSNAIATVLPTEEPEYSLSMGYEHLSTIPETESDEVIKSSVKNLVPIPSEYEVTSDDESECDVPVKYEVTSGDDESLSDEDVPMENFKIYSNPLFYDEEIISTKIDPHYEFSGELDHINPILLGIKEADFDLVEEIHLVENLLYDNSSPRPLKELNVKIDDTIVESLSPSLIPVEDSDSLMDEIDLFLAT
nr:hypothetical protein [Tanacetum cinerariifolium]